MAGDISADFVWLIAGFSYLLRLQMSGADDEILLHTKWTMPIATTTVSEKPNSNTDMRQKTRAQIAQITALPRKFTTVPAADIGLPQPLG